MLVTLPAPGRDGRVRVSRAAAPSRIYLGDFESWLSTGAEPSGLTGPVREYWSVIRDLCARLDRATAPRAPEESQQ
jgi:hypothetical protein